MKRTSGLELAFIRIPHQGCLLNAQAQYGQEVIMVKPKSKALSFSNSLWLITVLGLLAVLIVMFMLDHRNAPRNVSGTGSSACKMIARSGPGKSDTSGWPRSFADAICRALRLR